MRINWILHILMPVSIVLAFAWAPPVQALGDAGRIIFFHVPVAIVSVAAFLLSGLLSILYLFYHGERFPMLAEKSHNSACLGMLFVILTVITGSIWARISWGSFWNWDPRETSIVVLLLVYIAYFSLHSALGRSGSRDRITAVYLIFAMAMVPFFAFIVPRVYPSLHPDPIINPDRQVHLEERMKLTLLASAVSFMLLYFYMFSIMNRMSILKKKIGDRHE